MKKRTTSNALTRAVLSDARAIREALQKSGIRKKRILKGHFRSSTPTEVLADVYAQIDYAMALARQGKPALACYVVGNAYGVICTGVGPVTF
jgi:hypothetical protein